VSRIRRTHVARRASYHSFRCVTKRVATVAQLAIHIHIYHDIAIPAIHPPDQHDMTGGSPTGPVCVDHESTWLRHATLIRGLPQQPEQPIVTRCWRGQIHDDMVVGKGVVRAFGGAESRRARRIHQHLRRDRHAAKPTTTRRRFFLTFPPSQLVAFSLDGRTTDGLERPVRTSRIARARRLSGTAAACAPAAPWPSPPPPPRVRSPALCAAGGNPRPPAPAPPIPPSPRRKRLAR
jgi:hypothetical protein